MKLRATRTLTSASSSATRSSRATSSISLSVSRPRLRSFLKMPSKRSASDSNTGARLGAVSVEEGGGERLGDELDQIGGRLPHADELHRDPELGLDGEDHPAFGGAVELGQHDA